MIKVMADVVIPAMDLTNSTALEQANLVVGSLRLLVGQIDYAHGYEVLDVRSQARLIEELSRVVEDPESGLIGPAETAAHEALTMVNDPMRPQSEIRELSRRLRELTAEAVRSLLESASERTQRLLHDVVLVHAREQITYERAWVAKMGFDAFPDTLRTIPEALGIKSAD
jgi:hypothetical protein